MCNFSSYTTNANHYGDDLILQKLADVLPPKCSNTHFASPEQSCLHMESTHNITKVLCHLRYRYRLRQKKRYRKAVKQQRRRTFVTVSHNYN